MMYGKFNVIGDLCKIDFIGNICKVVVILVFNLYIIFYVDIVFVFGLFMDI